MLPNSRRPSGQSARSPDSQLSLARISPAPSAAPARAGVGTSTARSAMPLPPSSELTPKTACLSRRGKVAASTRNRPSATGTRNTSTDRVDDPGGLAIGQRMGESPPARTSCFLVAKPEHKEFRGLSTRSTFSLPAIDSDPTSLRARARNDRLNSYNKLNTSMEISAYCRLRFALDQPGVSAVFDIMSSWCAPRCTTRPRSSTTISSQSGSCSGGEQ